MNFSIFLLLGTPVACTSSSVCGRGGFCNFDNEHAGFCEFCSDVRPDSCADSGFSNQKGEDECKATCEG